MPQPISTPRILVHNSSRNSTKADYLSIDECSINRINCQITQLIKSLFTSIVILVEMIHLFVIPLLQKFLLLFIL